MAKNILITGGAGFIGSSLAVSLVDLGLNVRVLDVLSQQIHGVDFEKSPLYRSIVDKVEFVRGCITDRETVKRCLRGVDAVVHFAAETGTGQSMYAIEHYSRVNIGGTALLLDIIANENLAVTKLVVASSRAVYGEGKYKCAKDGLTYPLSRDVQAMGKGDFEVKCPICGNNVELAATDELAPVNPGSVYGITKLTQEQMFLTVGKALGISTIAFRYQNVYGPGQSLSNPYTGILSIFSTRIRNGKDINIFEDGTESRDFVFIDDVIDATIRGIESSADLSGVFNVGSGVSTDVLSIARRLQALLNQTVKTEVTGQFRVGDIRHNCADISKIGSVLGFSPRVSISEGLAKFVDWVKKEELQTDRYEESLQEMKRKGLFK